MARSVKMGVLLLSAIAVIAVSDARRLLVNTGENLDVMHVSGWEVSILWQSRARCLLRETVLLYL